MTPKCSFDAPAIVLAMLGKGVQLVHHSFPQRPLRACARALVELGLDR
eukprot:CAMPEP_0182850260 /NCGR_PEP_ID=MMETSP0006_2-20121128/29996_1 /TAXON_ID=97485 /ORGANISM="Prymnesium parvum, Strain Texoma1" /LENGTH=47 /DNA_ID= /DNA_START= /DNA_END= /DNA_ORIENTATION=